MTHDNKSVFQHSSCVLAAAALLVFLPIQQTMAQSIQPRGVIQPGSTLAPSAQQQLNQNLNRQQNNFSTQQRIESNNRLNRTQQINRNNSRTNSFSTCPGANTACRD
ncbi:hypothetical protein [Roseibium sp.]|uniref:hypothetical protein n=1 Tax=Roseibium sp. TaxID=1936156 RepID=UPI003B521868